MVISIIKDSTPAPSTSQEDRNGLLFEAHIRFSLDSDVNGYTTNSVRTVLLKSGFVWVGTGAYAHRGITILAYEEAITQMYDILLKLPPGTTLDHVWTYVFTNKGVSADSSDKATDDAQ